jgi:hypothetical protein
VALSLQDFQIVVNSAGLTTATTAYSVGDMLGTEVSLTNAAGSSGGSGVVTGIHVVDADKIIGALDIRLFNSASTPAADNAANSWSDANALKQVAGVQIGPPVVSANNGTISATGLWIPYTCAVSTLFLNVITLAAHTFFAIATNIQYTFELLRWV